MGGDGLEVNRKLAAPTGGVKRKVVSKPRPRPGGEGDRLPSPVPDRNHEVDRKPVLMGSMGREPTARWPSGLTVDEGQIGRGVGEVRIGLEYDVPGCAMEGVPAKEGAQPGIGPEVGTRSGKALAVSQVARRWRALTAARAIRLERSDRGVAKVYDSSRNGQKHCEGYRRTSLQSSPRGRLTPRISCRDAARCREYGGHPPVVPPPTQTDGRALPAACGC